MDQVWKEDAKESGAERRFQEMFAAQADEMDKSKREAAMKTARALAGGQLSHLMKLIFEVWADDVRISKEERMRQGFMDQFAEQDKQKKQQMERMVANIKALLGDKAHIKALLGYSENTARLHLNK